MSRSLSGEANPEEQQELSEFWNSHPEMMQQYELLRRMWDHHDDRLMLEEDYAGAMVSKIMHQVGEENEENDEAYIAFENSIRRRRARSRRNWIMAVGMVAIVAGGAWIYAQRSGSGKENTLAPKVLATQKGSRSRTLLPDGSTVWLNAGSKLEYVNDFNGPVREIKLEGEAFFDVVKQSRPFIVHTAGIDIKVLGTSFNVKSYPEDKNVETTLYHGSVKVFRHEESEVKAIHLKPNEKLILAKQAADKPSELSKQKALVVKETLDNFTIAHIDSTKKEHERFETAWLYSRLEFRGDGFEELARKLERWYNVTILFADEKVKQLAFNGSFEMETVEQAFKSLKEANAFNYKINNREILVSSR